MKNILMIALVFLSIPVLMAAAVLLSVGFCAVMLAGLCVRVAARVYG